MKIKLSNTFYTKQAVEAAVSAFSKICSCRIIDSSFTVEIEAGTEDEEEIAGEFCNFALGAAKETI